MKLVANYILIGRDSDLMISRSVRLGIGLCVWLPSREVGCDHFEQNVLAGKLGSREFTLRTMEGFLGKKKNQLRINETLRYLGGHEDLCPEHRAPLLGYVPSAAVCVFAMGLHQISDLLAVGTFIKKENALIRLERMIL